MRTCVDCGKETDKRPQKESHRLPKRSVRGANGWLSGPNVFFSLLSETDEVARNCPRGHYGEEYRIGKESGGFSFITAAIVVL